MQRVQIITDPTRYNGTKILLEGVELQEVRKISFTQEVNSLPSVDITLWADSKMNYTFASEVHVGVILSPGQVLTERYDIMTDSKEYRVKEEQTTYDKNKLRILIRKYRPQHMNFCHGGDLNCTCGLLEFLGE